MAITKAQIIAALDDLIAHEEGFRFQSLGVILATQKCDKLVAHEKKSDLGLDAYAPAVEFEDRLGRGAACSLTATLAKVKADIEEAQKHFKDLKVLYFVTPRPVAEKRKRKGQEWVQKVERDYGITLIVMSREHVVTALLSPENAGLCASHLHIHAEVAPSLEKTLEDCRQAIAEVNSSWKAKVEGLPLIELSADRLSSAGRETDEVVELSGFEDLLAQGLRITLEAPAGRGKTTTLTQIAGRRAAGGSLAFLVNLPSWAQEAPDILEFIAGMNPFKTRSLDAAKLGQLYRSQPFTFLLNGWNEIAEADLQRAATGLEALARDYRSAGILLTTRVRQVAPPLPGTTVRTRLRLLSQKQRADYVSSRVPDIARALLRKLNHDPVLDDLTRTPYFLAQVVSIAAAGKEIPNTKMGVLREVIRQLEEDLSYRSMLQSSPLHGQASFYLTAVASAMTSQGKTQLPEAETRQLLIRTQRRMREADLVDGPETGMQVLDALTSRHVLERLDDPHAAYRFEHQQLQEFYAAEYLKTELHRLSADSTISPDQIATTEAARTFQSQYINQSAWSEPLFMLASDLATVGTADEDAIRAGALLLVLALPIDMIFAAELFGLSGGPMQRQVAEKFDSSIRALWVSPEKHRRSYALTAMVATGSDLFKDELIPLIKGSGEHSRFEVYRSTSAFRLSSLGSDWQAEVRGWDENARLTFVSEITHVAAPLREMAAFALSDPSVKVRARAFSNLMWINTDDDTTKLLTEIDDEAFEVAIESTPLRSTHPLFRDRALKVYRKVLQESTDPKKRYTAAANAVLMGQADAHPALMQYLDECSVERIRELAQRELRPLLERLSSDPDWRTQFVIRRMREGALGNGEWGVFITSIGEDLKEEMLTLLETRDLFQGRIAGVQTLLRLQADSAMARRVFRRIIDLRREIQTANSVRSQENIALAQRQFTVERQLEAFLRSLPAQATVDGVLAALSPEFCLDELAALAQVWDWGMDNEADLQDAVTEESLQAIRMYLKSAVPALTNENDPRGEVRSQLAVAISRVGEPGDVDDIATLMASDVIRIRVGLAARAKRERTPLAEGSVMRYTNRYMLAVRQLKSESEGLFLSRLLAEPEFELEVAWALVAWAKTTDLPTTARIEGWANRQRDFEEIWQARTAVGVEGFNEARRVEAVGYLRKRMDDLRRTEGGIANEGSIVWRLKDLARPLAVLDGRDSSAFILDILALPLKTHGTLDGWKVLQALEVLLFAGAKLPNDKTIALVAPYVDQLTSKWQSDNDLSLLGVALSILPFVEDAASGIATLAGYLSRINVRFDGLRRVVAALGHCRREEAVDVLLGLIHTNDALQRFGQEWLDSIAALDNPRAREILLSVIDPDLPGVQGLTIVRLNVVFAPRMVEIAQRHAEIKARILALCNRDLDRSRKELLGEVIVHLKDGKALLASLDLLDDDVSPELPYHLQEAIEEAFVERIPSEGRSNSYTLQPRTATELREKLIEMTKSDSKRKQSALNLLARIESWRREYGRPPGETRNPLAGSGMAWPPESGHSSITES